ncbi:MAG: TIGR01777 family oxidoreductase [Flavobacteriales bacterium]|nr:TIGR01777 family oxidoreductase [Flavobacteriales bacterium]
MAKILITGGSGSIGKRLIPKLQSKGHEVFIIGRSKHNGLNVSSFVWDLEKGTMDESSLRDITHIIHLAGAGIADKPWSPKRKQEIIESRVKPLQILAKTLDSRNQRIKAIISSSAVGYYGGITSSNIFSEKDSAANDFLGSTCKMWEDAVKSFDEVTDREVRIRTGVVLMKEDGALAKLAKPVRFGFGAAVGSGNQWIPWIHVDDLVEIYLKSIEDPNLVGAYNAVALEHATQSVFIKKIGKALGKPVFLPPIPGFLLKAVLGEMSSVVTEGSRVSAQKLIDSDFEFKHPQLQEALNNLLA